MQLHRIKLDDIVRCLLKNNALFCAVDQLKLLLQKESDRAQLMQFHALILNTEGRVAAPVRKVVGSRAAECLDADCPICFCSYFGDSSNSTYLPLFQRCCQKTICYRCIMECVKNSQDIMQCPMCRADITRDIARRSMIVPLPQTVPDALKPLISNYQQMPRLTECVVKAVATLIDHGAKRIAILPDAQELKEDIEQALEFLMCTYNYRDCADVRDMFEQGFGVAFPDLRDFIFFSYNKIIYNARAYVFVADQYGINNSDIQHIEGFVVFRTRELEKVISIASNSLFGKVADLDHRIVLFQQHIDDSRCYLTEKPATSAV